MKSLAMAAFLLAPLGAYAQMPPAMDETQMQRMMQNMQRMRQCMQQLDRHEMEALAQRGRKMEAEVKTLCVQGRRDQAQAAAIAFAKETAKSPAMQQVQKCGQPMQGFIADMLDAGSGKAGDGGRHVCDGFD